MIVRTPLTDPEFPSFLDVTGCTGTDGGPRARTLVEVVQWSDVEGAERPRETARCHVDKSLVTAHVECFNAGEPREFYLLRFGGRPDYADEVNVYLSPDQFASLKAAMRKPEIVTGKRPRRRKEA